MGIGNENFNISAKALAFDKKLTSTKKVDKALRAA